MDIYIAFALQVLAGIAAAAGRSESAARLLGYSDHRIRVLDRRREMTERKIFEKGASLLKEQLGEQRFAEEFAAGASLTPEVALAEALVPPDPSAGRRSPP